MKAARMTLGPAVELRPMDMTPKGELGEVYISTYKIFYESDRLYSIFLNGQDSGEVGMSRFFDDNKSRWRANVRLADDTSVNKKYSTVEGFGETAEEAILDALAAAKKEMTVALQEVDKRWAAITGEDCTHHLKATGNRLQFK